MRKVVSIFTGCGGMDLGFEGGFSINQQSFDGGFVPKTGFETIFANDILPSAKIAWENYFSKRRNIDGIYHLDSVIDLVKRHKAGESIFPEADVVTGGFPCNDFSYAGKRQGLNSAKSHTGSIKNDDAPSIENRGMLYYWLREVIGIVKPKVFIAENVKGLASLGDIKSIIENDFRCIGDGYIVVPAKIMKAIEYGVPQTRERIIFIGFSISHMKKDGLCNIDPYPMKTHCHSLRQMATTGNLFTHIDEPNSSTDLSHKFYSKAKFLKGKQGNREINLNGPGPTIRAEHHGNIEYRRLSLENGGKNIIELLLGLPERRLSVRECAMIQTFPDDYEFVINSSSIKLSPSQGYKIIGNAVPPLLAWHIANRLNEIWDDIFI